MLSPLNYYNLPFYIGDERGSQSKGCVQSWKTGVLDICPWFPYTTIFPAFLWSEPTDELHHWNSFSDGRMCFPAIVKGDLVATHFQAATGKAMEAQHVMADRGEPTNDVSQWLNGTVAVELGEHVGRQEGVEPDVGDLC